MKRIGLAVLSVMLAAGSGAVGEGPRAVEGEPLFGTFVDPSRGGVLQAGVRWGELHVRGHHLAEVKVVPRIEVEASLAARLGDAEILREVRIELVERGNVMEVVVDSSLSGFHSVDLDVWVPRDTSVALEVRDGGNVRVEGVAGEVDVANRNGSVELGGLRGAAVVHARNGAIRAAFDAVAAGAPMSFSTLNGSIDVTFPETLSADVRLRYTRGGVESEFPIVADGGGLAEPDTTDLDARATRVLAGRIADGGPRYDFHTANGTIYLRHP